MEQLALYIHWPFCLAKCPYCDFNSHVREAIPQARFATALRRELAWEAERLGRRTLASIFFGGGTPSLMHPDAVAALIGDARALFDAGPDLEVTLEANPTSVEAGRFAGYRDAGVNRVSLGVQALDDAALRMLGRQHGAAQAVEALELARTLFSRVSFDLIYARPGQSEAAWRAELRTALSIAADHLSLYQLTIEPGTAFEALHRRGEIILPDMDAQAGLYEATAEEAARFGLLAYEVSNYARPGGESRHNLAYWRYSDYAGIGPGAHGRVTLAGDTPAPVLPRKREREQVSSPPPLPLAGEGRGGGLFATRRHRAPEPWAERVERDGHGTMQQEALSSRDRAREMLLMGLRLGEGVDEARFLSRTGMPIDDALNQEVLGQALDEGYLTRVAGRLGTTSVGRLRLDALLAALVE